MRRLTSGAPSTQARPPAHDGCATFALQVGEASKVAPVDKLSLVLVVVFAFAFLGERPSLREWMGIAMVACGVFVLAFKR